jgi:hypothetical protein
MPRSSSIFTPERGTPRTRAGFRTRRAPPGDASPLAFPGHPPLLRPAGGSPLAPAGHDTRAIHPYLGHKNIQHTVRHPGLQADRCTQFWTDER